MKEFLGYDSGKSSLPREWFARSDPNPTGFIDFHQLKRAFKFADLLLEDNLAFLMFRMVGLPENGLLSEDNFLGIWDYFNARRDRFKQLRGFENGLTLPQCTEALDKEVGFLRQYEDHGTIERLFRQLDRKNLGKIDWHQFVEMAYVTGGVLTTLEQERNAQKNVKPDQILPEVVPPFIGEK